ncbi:MAG: aminoacyl-tRNA hydrolase [Candidatus Omnitrophica bacterium]|nr:aminoacyl-tRNA hydrolase [Candidatus Omnitrophota bacterium]
MKLLVGLGNPGHTYNETRHNSGFAVIQWLAQRHQVAIGTRVLSRLDGRPAGVYGDYALGQETVRLLMPLTMMNESGEALRELPAGAQDVLILCDDVHLPLGAIRLRPEGGAGGHHGLQSCLDVLGTEAVPRLRIGVAANPLPRDLTEFVLSKFTSAERPLMHQAIAQAAEAAEAWATEGLEAAMNRYNRTQDAPT